MFISNHISSAKIGGIASLIMSAASLFCCIEKANAKEVIYSYKNTDETLAFVGTTKAELYDVALTLSDPRLKGARIVGIEVPVNSIPGLTDLKAWLTTELKLEADEESGRNVNAPNICSVDATLSNNVIYARFTEPYTIGENPVYVGYTFSVPEVSREDNDPARYPVAVAIGYEPGALMMHTRRHYLQWGDKGQSLGGKSAMKVIIDGDFPTADASLESIKDVQCQGDDTVIELPVAIKSFGSEPISSLKFSYTYQGKTSETEVKFDKALQPMFGLPLPVTVTISNQYVLGTEPIYLTLEEINGEKNTNTSRNTSFNLSVLQLYPKKRPIVEEYTGLWCGWCPKGYVGMETMAANEPDFIGIAYHNEDPMAILKDGEYPSAINGYPSCFIDRVVGPQPPSASTLKKIWGEKSGLYTPVDISVDVTRDSNNPKDINVKSTFAFVENPTNICRVAYLLLANGLTDDEWEQTNYYSNTYEEGMDWFYGKPKKITGLVFNDVLAMYSPFDGEEGSVPAPESIEPYKQMSHEYTFHTDDKLSLQGYDLIGRAGDNLTIVALMLDTATKEVLNAAKVNLKSNRVEHIEYTPEDIASVCYYNLSGISVASPSRGLYIKITEYKNGTRVADKVILK